MTILNDTASFRYHKDDENLWQAIYQILGVYFEDDFTSYAVRYGEFMYQVCSWKYPHRVVCKVEKPAGQFVPMYPFIVTNMDSSPELVIRFYCKRGTMENDIKESKNGFDFAAVSSSSKIVNANRLQVHAWHTTYLIGLNAWYCQ